MILYNYVYNIFCDIFNNLFSLLILYKYGKIMHNGLSRYPFYFIFSIYNWNFKKCVLLYLLIVLLVMFSYIDFNLEMVYNVFILFSNFIIIL